MPSMLTKVKYVAVAAVATLAVAAPGAGAAAPSPSDAGPATSQQSAGYWGHHCHRYWNGYRWITRCWQ
jgi:hypothetical protein